jgi:LacI family transcriptional regulator
VTIQDVARASGVAPSTVSNALAGKPHVRDTTRRLVEETAAALGYRASTMARGLRLRRSWTIGLIISDIANPFFASVARGVEDVALAAGWHTIIGNSDYSSEKQAASVQTLLDRGVDGLILACQDSEGEHVAELAAGGVPFVLFNRRHRRVVADYVGVDNRAGILAGMCHLAKLGHRRIGFIRGPDNSTVTGERHRAYEEASTALGLTIDDRLLASADLTIEGGERAARTLLRGPRTPTAILATNDFMSD